MKIFGLKIFAIVFAAMLSMGAMAQPKAKYLQTMHDFGVINEADGKVSCAFEIENEGNEPLVIIGVYVKCGCVTYDFTKEPIKPGEKGVVNVTLDPSGREGKYIKSIHIYTNTNMRKKTVRIYSEIKPAPVEF